MRGSEMGPARSIQVDAEGEMAWSEEQATSYLNANSDKFLFTANPSSVVSTQSQVCTSGERSGYGFLL